MSERPAKPRVRVLADGTFEVIAAPVPVPVTVSVPTSPAAAAVTAKPVPWKGRPRVPDPKARVVTLRMTPTEYATLTAAAAQSGFSVGAYVRAMALGSAGPRAIRRPAADRVELARLLGLLGNYGSNLNQLARAANADGELPTAAELTQLAENVAELRQGVMYALGRETGRERSQHGD